ncbi:LOW QUALITY PROTEIN: hypothetical protein RJ639_042992 [Escallonia herrerae]|uniref:Retrotransposon gag domain-containing protein n=1 Tax=Escallonia herrerae TaxID=1293975 RepID=A0AA88WFD7_9ASTE|nr:LOW QUALITY PROTEIN: hypothetical protein RJ639_042992 [Escallonia herrerae]
MKIVSLRPFSLNSLPTYSTDNCESTVEDLSSAIGDACMKSELEALGEHLQQTVASQVELIFNRLDDLERKVDVFAKELDDLIEERVTHFMKWEVQQRKDLKGQVTELQKELAACKKELTRAMRQGCIAVQPRRKKMPKPRSYNGAREARQVGNFFWHLELYFEALDIDDEEEKVQKTVMYLTVKTWEKFKRELQRQFYPESIEDMAMINLRWLRQKGSIREYVKEYSTLMLKIPEMSERQQLCFFIDSIGLPQSYSEGNLMTWLLPLQLSRGWETSSEVRGRDLQGTSVPKIGETVGQRVASPRQSMMSGIGTRDVATITRGRRSMREVTSRVTLMTTRLMEG